MKTFQDLMKAGANENARGKFCATAVEEFRGTREYADAKAGMAYYEKHNLTIEQFQKYLYTVTGRQVPDIFSANYKLKTLFFRRLITQQVQYVLGNGVTVDDKEKLGKDFDFQLQQAAKKAMAGGRAFGFWNFDHLEVFGFADTAKEAGFCPLYNEETGQLDAGIRFWHRKIGDDMVFRYTLYEVDGITEYRKVENNDVTVLREKHSYKQTVKRTTAGTEEVLNENYSALPIVPLYANDTKESELIGIRECIDCYDYIKSGLANDIDDTSGFYWVLKNTGGMDDKDLAQFVQRMKTIKATVLDGDDGVEAEAHTLDIPTEARKYMLELLRKDIYEDAQLLDLEKFSASAKTTQEIQAAYQPQDNKCSDFEYMILEFTQKILELAGINAEPTFRWNKVLNQTEQTSMVLSAANYLTDEMVIRHLPFLTPEEAEEVINSRTAEDYNRFETDEKDDEEE